MNELDTRLILILGLIIAQLVYLLPIPNVIGGILAIRYNHSRKIDKIVTYQSMINKLKFSFGITAPVVVGFRPNSKNVNCNATVWRGRVYVVFDKLLTPEIFEPILAHEFAHIKLGHNRNHPYPILVKCIHTTFFITYAVLGYMYIIRSSYFFEVAEILFELLLCISLLFYIFSRRPSREIDADFEAAKIVGAQVMRNALELLQPYCNASEKLDRIFPFFRSHPPIEKRIRLLKNFTRINNL